MGHFLTSLAQAEIDNLTAEGISLSPDEIIEINELARRVENPQTRLALSRGCPVAVGGVYLWPMTLAGADWFRRHGDEFGSVQKQTYALAFAMSNGRDQLPEDIRQAKSIVKAWANKLTCRDNELEEAIKQIVEQEEIPDVPTDKTDKDVSATSGEISLMLAAMTKTAPSIWEYQVSIGYVLAMLDCLAQQDAAEGKSLKHSNAIRAERALGLAIARIRRKHKNG